ncbi:hypothetical protein ABRZ08_13280 [Castellaniella ginsengisoli]|uniref:Uncharacterized protein n=1 Tax=Castellaniella ginsengisoli TaxID=546114 RepID=A0AB39G1L7_9BURK
MSLESFFQAILSGSIAGAIVAGLVIKLWGSYVTEKGKNLATKQDIGEITKELERAKQPFFELQEQIRSTHQLRFAAIDKRLQAHQDAFVMWVKLMNAVHTKDRMKMVGECQEFWRSHCLYLDPNVREALSSACFAAQVFTVRQERTEKAEEDWKTIMAFPDVLFEAIRLTPISHTELERLKKPAEPDQHTAS